MKKLLFLLSFTTLFFSCSEDKVSNKEVNNAITNSQISAREFNCSARVENLIAGKNYLAGNITVGNDSENLYVTYQAAENWYFTTLHLFVGNYQSIQLNNGNPAPGQFPYSVNFNQQTQMYTFVIPISQLENTFGCFTVATHASMYKKNANGQITQTETAWSGANNFPGKNWAKYFNTCLCTQDIGG